MNHLRSSIFLVVIIATNLFAMPITQVQAYMSPTEVMEIAVGAPAEEPPAGYEDEVRVRPPRSDWFSDVDPDSRIGIAANFLADEGIIGGFPDGTFRENQLVNRAEMAKSITNADKTCDVGYDRNNGRFSDLIEGEWYVRFVMAAARCGIIYGNLDGTFAPERSVNTVELLAMIARAQFGMRTNIDHIYSDVPADSWFNEYAGAAQEQQFFPERRHQFLEPSRPLTRGEVAYVLYRILSEDDDVEHSFRILDVDNIGENTYFSGDEFNVRIETRRSNGEFTDPVDGFNVQVYIQKENGNNSFGGNAHYTGGGIWKINGNFPIEAGEYIFRVILYCSRDDSECRDMYDGRQEEVEIGFNIVEEDEDPPQAEATLSLREISIGTSDTAVGNQQDVNLFRFEATAGSSETVVLTETFLKADEGDLDDAEDYTLWVDSNEDGSVDQILQSGVRKENRNGTEIIIFDANYAIYRDGTALFEVHADIVGSPLGDRLSVGFADNDGISTNLDFVMVETDEADNVRTLICISVDGNVYTPGCTQDEVQITVYTITSKVVTLKPQGSLYVYQSSIPTPERQLLAGELSEPVLHLAMHSADEPIDVTRLVFTNLGGSTDNISRLKLYRWGEIDPFAFATVDNCNSISGSFPENSFCAVMESQQYVIDRGDGIDILVRAQMKSDEEGAVSDNAGGLQFAVLRPTDFGTPGTPADTTGNTTISARGFESSNVLFFNDGDSKANGEIIAGRSFPGPDQQITGNKNDTVLSKIVTIENANYDADGSQVPVGTNRSIAEFKFTAAANSNTRNGRNKARIQELIFTVAAQNVLFGMDGFELYNKNDITRRIPCHETSVQNTFYVSCHQPNNSAVDTEIASGDSIAFVLEADIITNQIDSSQGSSLQVSLDSFTDPSKDRVGAASQYSHVQWFDDTVGAGKTFLWIEYPETSVSSTLYRN